MKFIVKKQFQLKPGDFVHIVGSGASAANAKQILNRLKGDDNYKTSKISNEYTTRVAYLYIYLGENVFFSLSKSERQRIRQFNWEHDLNGRDWIVIFKHSTIYKS